MKYRMYILEFYAYYMYMYPYNMIFFLPENKIVLDTYRSVIDVGSTEITSCNLKNETSFIRWFNSKNQEINSTSGARIEANKNGNLIIKNVQLSDGGTYECRRLEYTKYFTIYVNGKLSDCKHGSKVNVRLSLSNETQNSLRSGFR